MSVDTGMSVATLSPLAKAVRAGVTVESKMVGGYFKKGHQNLYGKWSNNNARFKSREIGRKLGHEGSGYKMIFGNNGLQFEFTFNLLNLCEYEKSKYV